MRATRTITLILQMRHNTHIAKTMAARREEGILDNLHAYRAQNILIQILRPALLLRRRRRGWRIRRRLFRRRRLHRGHRNAGRSSLAAHSGRNLRILVMHAWIVRWC